MIQLTFSPIEIEALETERYTHPHPKVQRKMEALYLKSLKLEHHLICTICRIKEPTFVRYLRAYESEGMAGLKQFGYAGQPSKLRSHKDSLEEHFRKHPPATSAEAQSAIEQLTGVRRSPTQVREFLHRLGMKHRKTGFVPGPSDTPEKQAEQAAFVKKTSNPNWHKPKRGSGWFFSWMPLILSIRPIWDSCGVSSGFS
jgi:transposase